jgi:eukaryotic-like serine/threonine-protein kinase
MREQRFRMASASGELLKGRYRIGPVLGEGAMGTVVRAYDETLCRAVAIKLLKPTLGDDAEFVARFYAEARALAGLVDRRIVAIHDVLADGATHAIVMEYVNGPSLAAVLAREGRLPEERAVRYARQIALALAVAHGRGVLHRDVKPANVLLTAQDEVKVADFGLAKALVADVERSLTMTGTVIGSASYFSPEQAQGLPLTAASDLYSLGVVLHQLVTGTLPFEGASPVSIAVAHVTTPPPTQAALARVMSRKLAAIVHRLLQKDPAARFTSAAELAAALTEPEQSARFWEARTPVEPAPEPIPVVPPRPRRTARSGDASRMVRAFGIVAALVLIAFGGMWALRSRTIALADVRHAPLTRARAVLDALGVRPAVESRPDMTVPAGNVIAERPAPGARVHQGDAVQLVVSSGPPIVTVPDVRGKATTSAERVMLGVHLHPNVASRPDDAPARTVIAQQPDPGTQLRGGANVVLIVSSGPPQDDNADAGTAPGAGPGNDNSNATPPPGWLRRQWWHLFRHHRHPDGPPPPP